MEGKVSWTDEEITQLISLYEKKECLWNTKNNDYRNRDKKNKILNEIADKFNCSFQEVQRKLHNLRNQVTQELNKIRKKRRGPGGDDFYCSKWKFFQQLKFIIPTVTTNKTTLYNLPGTYTETQQEAPSDGTLNERHDDRTGYNNIVNDTNEPEQRKNKKRKTIDTDDHDVLKAVVEIMKKPKDEFDRFGEYVALELRSLKSEQNRRRLKSEIRKAIVCIADEDDYLWASANTSTSSPIHFSDSSPIPSPPNSTHAMEQTPLSSQ